MKLSETTFNNADTRYYRKTEADALLRAVADEVGKLPHAENCNSLICVHCYYSKDWVLHRLSEFREGGHEFKSNECNCQLGKALAMLEVE